MRLIVLNNVMIWINKALKKCNFQILHLDQRSLSNKISKLTRDVFVRNVCNTMLDRMSMSMSYRNIQ